MRRAQTCRCHRHQQPTPQHLLLMPQLVKLLLRQRLMPQRLQRLHLHLQQSNQFKSV
jgi:hypothetical protein